jgi:N-methylhydantoinase A/oxoprolinase/acetone carboxylase beta subunit
MGNPADLRLGVVVGPTNADAAVLDDRDQVVVAAKVAARNDGPASVAAAIRAVLGPRGASPGRIGSVMVGSMDLRRGLAEGRHPVRVAVVRIGSPLTLAVPPLATWPERLRLAVSAGEIVVAGGAEFDGRSAGPLDEESIARFLRRIDGRIDAVAVTAVFSPGAPQHELAAAAVVRRELGPSLHVSLSHELGTPGLLERENAAVLNAALVGAVRELDRELQGVLAAEGIAAELFFAANDGTLMAQEYALRFPVSMIGSSAACSMRGAAHLSGVRDAVVLDVGGVTSTVGLLVDGFPQEAEPPNEIAGVRSSFRMPDVRSVPLGGGSIVRLDTHPPRVGPESVGSALAQRALVFGGPTPTLTDAAVAGGRLSLGTHRLDDDRRRALVDALAVADRHLALAVLQMTGTRRSGRLVVVGGACAIVAGELAGFTAVIRPEHADVASAIGAATAPVSGQADRICLDRPEVRRTVLRDAREAALDRAIAAGADPDAVEIVGLDEVPLAGVVDPTIHIRVKAAGPRA